jgi:hypothetical protein
MTTIKTDFLIIGLITVILFLGLHLQQGAYSQGQNQTQDETEILCAELAKLNEMLPPDTVVLPSTAAGQSLSEKECGFKPNVDPEALAEAQEELNQSSN